jgi:hypothetical protein
MLLELERQILPAPILKGFGFCALALTIAGAYIRLQFRGCDTLGSMGNTPPSKPSRFGYR